MTKENLKVKDHSVSGEVFELIQNLEYGFLETTPQPSSDKLSDYYESEDYISHTDSKRNLFEKAYHLVRSVSLKKKLNLINSFPSEDKKLLDIGCGTGDFLQTAQQNNWIVSGIEPNQQAREIANKKTNGSVFNTEQLLKFQPKSFDVITLWHVLEHLPNLDEQIATFKKLLKPNGTLIIAVPNYKSFDAQYYKSFWAAYDVPRHLWHFNKTSVSNLVSKQSFKVNKIKPMWFDSFYVSMLSEKYKTGSMNAVKGFWIGLRSNLKAIGSKEASSLIYVIKNS
ncbi:class I SAM-dependent methyltransferase [Algibacter amylolyticus]|uniref:Class I SAM-dependent methyltransferase n=1 Tax=Algibacter amylolyticus TaxID=1608400 RepID=A0A5M7BG30_9FLAO|nr:class I SAM-dependent methyltransferase [Algibacter amylolyticus]KAA5827437.1 class I SAM-dependent methyltransferase [Algibacter amylolyticus]MBB5266630.1 2-polyprenyl-3-methyl-5-hydroxy-6-metoxy-1,4-benzoquinol methylase [Algibacter amylolyticus]TSJ81682.1 class I SAM-dependent methyltransferase [Algibacter amylolyticus]